MQINLLSYNIEVGVETKNYSDYFFGGWKHFLPTQKREENLKKIAEFLSKYDIVALQEVDAGSLRSGYVNQVEFLAEKAGFEFWHTQVNRNLGRFAKYSNGFLSRFRPQKITDHKLPGFLPGRGAIVCEFGSQDKTLVVVMVHLALSARARLKQISYIANLAKTHPHVVVMGDMNCSPHLLGKNPQLRSLGIFPISHGHTFPSWKPIVSLDHVLVTPEIQVSQAEVLGNAHSDHLPVAVELILPFSL